MDQLTRLQNDDSIRNFLKSSAEMFYRLRPCSSCGRQRMYVCVDGHLRCEKCSLDIEAEEGDLADVFGSVDGYMKRLKSNQETSEVKVLAHKKDDTCPSCQNVTKIFRNYQPGVLFDPGCGTIGLRCTKCGFATHGGQG